MPISKTIHQIWVGPKEPPYEWMDTWVLKHPTWEYILWDNLKLKQIYPYLTLQHKLNEEDLIIDNKEKWNCFSDYLRWEILYKFGGVYLDADTICLNPIPEEYLKDDFFTCYLNEKQRPGRLASGIMGAQKGHPILKRAIDGLVNAPIRTEKAHIHAGPTYFTSIIQPSDLIKIYPSHIFLPYFLTDNEEVVDLSECISVHIWGTTDTHWAHGIADNIWWRLKKQFPHINPTKKTYGDL